MEELPPQPSAAEIAARQAYVACLTQAAHFADVPTASDGSLAQFIAPMCYPRFSQYAATAKSGLTQRQQLHFDRDSDALQSDLAIAAVRQYRKHESS